MLDPSRMKEFADDNVKFDENGGKFPKRMENTVEKGEIARNKQFLLFSQCLPKTCTADKKKQGLFWERVNPFPHNDTFRRPWETSLLKTLWEKEKLLVMSNFSFSHSVFYPFG